MKNLFYSTKEKILFWITGYTRDLNTYNVKEICESLQKNQDNFKKNGGEGVIKTKEITKSRRYKRMRVFWCKKENSEKEAFELGEDWTMDKWIGD